MDLTYEEIPEDLWEDWVWLVSPPGLTRGVEEETQPLLNSPYQLTSTYTVNFPKIVLFHMSWSCAVEADGDVSSNDLRAAVHMDTDVALQGLLFLLKNYPLVLRWKLDDYQRASLAPNLWDDLQEPPELLWHVPQELEGRALDLESISIEFFNPFVPALRLAGIPRSVIGVISPVKSMDLAISSLIPGVESDWREAMAMAIYELERRGLVEIADQGRMRLTERGRRMVVTEPLSDCLSCRCRIEEVMEYEMGGDDD
ncbi:MAG: hypothetical protein JET69_04285 [Methanomassiliicoccales archaeon]|nr:hypothetical protein [Methanomassiliicoccales archaeon]